MTGRFVDVPSARLWVESAGVGDPIVFIHGFTLDARMWTGVAEHMADRCHAIAYDVRGFGRSSVPSATPYAHRDDLAALLDALGLTRVHLVGHSIGAHQALEFALEHPHRVRSLALIAASGLSSLPFPPEIAEAFVAVRRTAGAEGVDAAKAIWRKVGWFSTRPESARVDDLLRDYSGWHWLNRNPYVPLEPPPSTRLGEITAPTLVMVGEHDLPYNHRVGDLLVEGIASARRVDVPGVGHMLPMEDPSAVAATLREFVDGIG